MAVSLTHPFVSAKADGADATLIQPSNWNAGHTLTSGANTVLARAAATDGDVSEVALAASRLLGRGSTGDVAAITLGSGLSMSGTTLSSTASTSPGGSTTQLQYNNAGAFAGASGITTDGTDLTLGSASRLLWSTDLILARDAANALGLRNGTNWQKFSVYSTYTDAANYERLSIRQSGSHWLFGPENAGTGVGWRNLSVVANGDLLLGSNGGEKWRLNTSGHFRPETSNVYDIGTSGNLPRYVRVGSALVTASSTVATLPAAGTAGAGAIAHVTDATATTARSTVAGGGANAVLVMSDGTNWLIVA